MAIHSSKYQKALQIQREISETLNKSTDLYEILQLSLERLLDLMELETGWIFLTEDETSYHLAADYQFPPAITDNRAELMQCHEGCTDCVCLQLYWEGAMKKAVNHVKCIRLEEAAKNNMGETQGLTHHASIPLTVRGKKIGLLNLASPGRHHFHEDELILLETLAYQIGAAVERTRLYLQQTQAEVDSVASYLIESYANAEKVNREIGNILNRSELFQRIMQSLHDHLPTWTHAAIITMEQGRLTVQFCSDQQGPQEVFDPEKEINLTEPDIVRRAYVYQQIIQDNKQPLHFSSLTDHNSLCSIACPLYMPEWPEEKFGVLLLSRSAPLCNHLEMGMVEGLANHLSMGIERIRLHKEWERLLVDKERNRLARDLHDSVNQKLFALSLTSRGLQELVDKQETAVLDAVLELQQLSKEALTDMRSLIWQLRPDYLEQGLMTLLMEYAQKIGINLSIEAPDDLELSQSCKEALLRIGQEALNNIQKHAGTSKAMIHLQSDSHRFTMQVMDQGDGGAVEVQQSLGIKSMKERTEELQGSFHMNSEKGKGTTITVRVPVYKKVGDTL
ncbi:GAF domain-containing sensor histidine kinase [Gracilibacillus alcaliphilus]|uniref:GAF domain-containing sensor histidine kinase n=1 Tax=Gracilibacillus alcaliphilus TaxID=1401441 RepID=UPI00195EFC0E|nr:GAF domain-containing sensor histidine kinase [Gracilibacillus alcaliphilus]MBM7679723.1 nitrate/nitrite-specific signal transduction histidine kinase [Gracilibacillus alcaliphilus]